MRQALVKDWMTREVVTINPYVTWPEADRLMVQKGIRRLPVIAHGRLVGIVTQGDVRGAKPSDVVPLSIWELSYMLAELEVEKIMTSDPLTISPEATIKEAAQIMLDNKISGLPVLNEKQQLVGIITESDIFRVMVQAWDSEERQLQPIQENFVTAKL